MGDVNAREDYRPVGGYLFLYRGPLLIMWNRKRWPMLKLAWVGWRS